MLVFKVFTTQPHKHIPQLTLFLQGSIEVTLQDNFVLSSFHDERCSLYLTHVPLLFIALD